MNIQDIVIVGAGAAGCFAAAITSELNPSLKIRILEKTRQPLAKVKISGGGRCNVTHHCFDPSLLVENYPRGKEFLRSAFTKFQPQDMIDWLLKHGVDLKTEADGRMFPTTNQSQTIIDCLLKVLSSQGVVLSLESDVHSLSKEGDLFRLDLKYEVIYAKKVLLATGGLQRSYFLAESLGHLMEPAIPSLFTFELKEDWIKAYCGFSVPKARVSLKGFSKETLGPVLVTHWGVSGPAILKLSAFAARWLFDQKYQAEVVINWVNLSKQEVLDALFAERKKSASKKLLLTPLFSLSKNFWKAFLTQVAPNLTDLPWAQVPKDLIQKLSDLLTHSTFTLTGKSLNKDEFVTSGGISLKEVDPKTLQSKKVAGLYFAGELLDIDGITGGFNFQNAWTTGFLAASDLAKLE